MATPKQKLAVEAVVNGSNLTNAMKVANYAASTSKRTNKLTRTKGYKELTKPILEQLEEQRQLAFKRAKETVSKAQYRHVMEGIDKTSKLIQLLSGGATENQVIKVEGINYIVPPNPDVSNS